MSIDVNKTLYLKSGMLDVAEIAPEAGSALGDDFLRFTGDALEFDFYLPAHMLTPGTVLLTSNPHTPGGKVISKVQNQIFEDEDCAIWSHVALIGGDGLVWEANPNSNITACALAAFFRKNVVIHGRRLVDRQVDVNRLDLIISEQKSARYPQLSDLAVLRYFVNAMRKSSRKVELPFLPDELICSSFVHRVLMLSLNFEPFPSVPLAFPGHFAQSDMFECLDFRNAAFRLTKAA